MELTVCVNIDNLLATSGKQIDTANWVTNMTGHVTCAKISLDAKRGLKAASIIDIYISIFTK